LDPFADRGFQNGHSLEPGIQFLFHLFEVLFLTEELDLRSGVHGFPDADASLAQLFRQVYEFKRAWLPVDNRRVGPENMVANILW
jgi:hypothetical protein